MMTYKGYKGEVVYDHESKTLHGEVIGTRAVITFQGTSANDIEQAFKDSIDDYIEWCEERGKEPEKPFSGKLLLRIEPKLHEKLTVAAAKHNISLNKFISEKLVDSVNKS